VALMVALELQPTKLEVNFDTIIIFGVVDIFSGIEGSTLIQAFAPIKATTHSNNAIDPV